MMVCLNSYFATDRRVYDGAFCSDMQKEQRHTEKLKKHLNRLEPTAHVTYFPVEEGYQVFLGVRSLTGNFHNHIQSALIEAIEFIES